MVHVGHMAGPGPKGPDRTEKHFWRQEVGLGGITLSFRGNNYNKVSAHRKVGSLSSCCKARQPARIRPHIQQHSEYIADTQSRCGSQAHREHTMTPPQTERDSQTDNTDITQTARQTQTHTHT